MYQKLLDYLKTSQHPAVKFLSPGLKYNEIADFEIQNNIQLSQNVIEFYNVFNGTNNDDATIGELSLFPNGIPISLEYSLEIYRYNIKYKWWKGDYIPIFTSGGNDFYLIQNSSSYKSGSVFYFSHSNPDFNGITSIFDSESTMIETIIECYKRNVYIFNGNFIDFDFKLEAKIAKPLNPNSEYWKIIEVE